MSAIVSFRKPVYRSPTGDLGSTGTQCGIFHLSEKSQLFVGLWKYPYIHIKTARNNVMVIVIGYYPGLLGRWSALMLQNWPHRENSQRFLDSPKELHVNDIIGWVLSWLILDDLIPDRSRFSRWHVNLVSTAKAGLLLLRHVGNPREVGETRPGHVVDRQLGVQGGNFLEAIVLLRARVRV